MERCILKVSTSSVAVGTDDLDNRRSEHLLTESVGGQNYSSPSVSLHRPPLTRCHPRLPDPANTEANAAVLKRRQKQIQYGKNTSGYQNYLQQVPK